MLSRIILDIHRHPLAYIVVGIVVSHAVAFLLNSFAP